MKMEKLTKQVALLIAVVTGMGVVKAEEQKGTGQVATHHEATHHIVSGQTKHPVHGTRAHHIVSGGPRSRTKPQRGNLQKLHDVIQEGQLDRVHFFLKSVDINDKDSVGKTPVHYALGQPEIMKFLIAQGADVKSSDNWDYTPLHYAARDGYEDVIEILLGAGADINAPEWTGRTPLDLAVQHGRTRAAKLLHDKGGRTGKGPSRVVASGHTARSVSSSKK